MNVVLHYQASPALESRLERARAQGLAVVARPPQDHAGLLASLAFCEVLWHCLAPATAELIAAAPRLRLIQKIGVGVNTIDLDACRARGIAVCNMPGTNTRAVAEHSLALMLACLRRVPWLDRATREARGWSDDAQRMDELGEIGGRTVGLVGFGAVPAMLAPVLLAMGATVLAWSRTQKAVPGVTFTSLEDLLARSDIVSLHLPLTDATARLIDRERLARLPEGAILVNTARGGLVDEPALVDALRSGRLRAAGLDVFAHEPVAADNPLLGLPNVVLAPHVAWLTPETLDRSLEVAIENCRRLKAGEPLLNRVV
jgi:phosphoglycerate dehydrogenase-like enzyme